MELTDRFSEALTLAERLHRAQRRKGGEIPYVSHLLAVTALVLEHGGTQDEAIAALLHDAVEDQGGPATRAAIAARFGEHMARVVDECSDTDELPKPPWRSRKEHHLRAIAGGSASARLIMAADKLHNAQSMLRDHRRLGSALWERFTAGREGTLWYYRGVIEALRQAGDVRLIDELAEAVQRLEQCD